MNLGVFFQYDRGVAFLVGDATADVAVFQGNDEALLRELELGLEPRLRVFRLELGNELAALRGYDPLIQPMYPSSFTGITGHRKTLRNEA